MDKIKVSKEIAEALDLAIKVSGKKSLLDDHASVGCWTLKEYIPLNKLSNWDLAEILIYGYEVEKTPEEKILEYYNYCVSESKLKLCDFDKGYWDGAKHAILNILEFKNEKIKGIND